MGLCPPAPPSAHQDGIRSSSRSPAPSAPATLAQAAVVLMGEMQAVSRKQFQGCGFSLSARPSPAPRPTLRHLSVHPSVCPSRVCPTPLTVETAVFPRGLWQRDTSKSTSQVPPLHSTDPWPHGQPNTRPWGRAPPALSLPLSLKRL